MSNTSGNYSLDKESERREYNLVQHLSSAIFPFDARERLMAMLIGYFDESYTHPPAPRVYTLGGYISTDRKWKRFQQEWGSVLNVAGIPFFHMAKYEARKKEYEGWTDEKRIRILRTLHGIIKKRVLAGFAVSLVLSDYEEIMTDEIKAYFGNPHEFVTIACMKYIALWLHEQNYKENISYVFESGSGYDADVMRLFAGIINDEKQADFYRVNSCSIENKRKFLPLQAADILAYEVTKVHAREVDSGNTRPIRQSIRNLRLPSVNEWYYFNKEELLKVVNSAKERGTFNSPPSTP